MWVMSCVWGPVTPVKATSLPLCAAVTARAEEAETAITASWHFPGIKTELRQWTEM